MSSCQNGLPDAFRQSQSYLDRFNGRTTISYQLPTQGHLAIEVYDVLGREVATLVDGVRERVYKSAEFCATGRSASGGNASRLASDVYFCRLVVGEFQSMKRMVVLR